MKSIFKTLTTAAFALTTALGAAGSAWAETEEEKNYYLEQMKKASQSKQPEPTPQAEPVDNGDLIADSGPEDTSSETDYSSIGELKPELGKPKLDFE